MAEQLNYRPNRQARLLKGRKSGMIGMLKVISFLQITEELALYAGDRIHRAGYELTSSEIFWHRAGVNKAVESMIDAKVEGSILSSLISTDLQNVAMKRLQQAGIPIVSMGGDKIDGIPCISFDYYLGGYRLAQHLAKSGRQKIAGAVMHGYDHPGKEHWACNRIAEGARAALREAGYSPEQFELAALTTDRETRMSGMHFEPGKRLMTKLLKQKDRPDAVIFFQDYQAIGALQACREMGVDVPREIAITGFDGTSVGEYSHPTLTSLNFPVQELAKQAVDLLFSAIRGDSLQNMDRLIAPELKIRESSYQPS